MLQAGAVAAAPPLCRYNLPGYGPALAAHKDPGQLQNFTLEYLRSARDLLSQKIWGNRRSFNLWSVHGFEKRADTERPLK